MKIVPVVSLLLIALISALPLKAEGPLKIADGQSIAFLGDSITQLGQERPGGYVKLVIAGFKSIGLTIKLIPAGVSGNTSRDMLARLQRSVLDQKPTWMTLSCGVNDVWHGANGVDLETYKKNITSIVDQVRAAGIKVMILTSTPIMENDNDLNKKLAGYNDFLRQLAKEQNLPLVDLSAAFWARLKASPPHPGTNLLTVDGVHMNPEGNILMARGILEGFGVTPAQVDQYEAQWRQSDDGAALLSGLQLNGVAGVPVTVYDNVAATARARKVRPSDVANELYFQALREVLKAHEQDENLSLQQILPEVNKAFAAQAEALPPAQTTPPPATAVSSKP